MRRSLLLSIVAAIAACALLGQSFEVASIKPNRSGSGGSSTNTSHGNLTATNVSVRMLLQMAFGVKDFQIEGGPGWLATERYDIAARSDTQGDLTDREFQPRLQSLLADRFQLKYHRETKERSIPVPESLPRTRLPDQERPA